ncbi:MAG TPA: radical SAM protein [Vicinamibacterales bacterium]|nr:radical SAM protein [Vicinamibacterales bacterium]
MLSINEIFYSIQGESTYAGRPCVFVRLAGCDLRCSWCDTSYAFAEGQKMSIDDVIRQVEAFGSPLVEVTGGEPLLQEDVYPLMDRLLDGGRTVLLETGGQIDVSRVPGAVIKVMDVKCPASGESDKVEWGNIDRLGSRDQVKFVIQDRADYEFARATVKRHALDRRCAAVLFSPVHGVLTPQDLSEWILEDRLPVRLQIQLHKHIWGANVRGV